MIGQFFKKLFSSSTATAENPRSSHRQTHSSKSHKNTGADADDKNSDNKNRGDGKKEHSSRSDKHKSHAGKDHSGKSGGDKSRHGHARNQVHKKSHGSPLDHEFKKNLSAAKELRSKLIEQHQSWAVDSFVVEPTQGKSRFHDLDLSPQVMHAVADLGFEYCSPIQAQSLPYALQGKDVVGKAQTGTGKTAAFLIAIIEDLLANPIDEQRYAGEARALVIAPTRELVLQIADDAKNLCKYTDLKIHTLVGGMDYAKQQKHLHSDLVDILVATPGRLLDFCGNKDVYLDQLEILVIDEADRMLDMGFIPQVRQIVRQTPKREERQTLFFSATFTQDVHNLVEQWTYKPVTVDIQPENVANTTVDQHVYLVSSEEKFTLLYNLIQQEHSDSMIVFANRRDECRDLHETLLQHHIKAGLLSGEITQQKRVSTLDAFKKGELKILVATDVAGRGIHINDISHVVNFTLPEEPEDYVHRIGRTGRAGKSGISISFACEDDALRLEPIEKLLGKTIKCEQPPENLLMPVPVLEGRTNHTTRPSRPAQRGRSSRSSGQGSRPRNH